MNFDSTSFCRFLNKAGKGKDKAFRYQAMELIKICRVYSAASEQSHDQDRRLQEVLEACDKAIKYAARPNKNGSGLAEDEIDKAIRKLHEYKKAFHPNDPAVGFRMEAAKDADKRLKDKKWINTGDGTLVRFHILRSLRDTNPIVVQQLFISTWNLSAILWIFSLYEDNKRLNLVQNPHFYGSLPAHATPVYEGKSMAELTKPYPDTIYILTNNEHRIFLDLGKRQWIFDNIWNTGGILLFRDITGTIKGESIVGQCIPAFPLFCSLMEHPGFEPEMVKDIKTWRAKILGLLNSQHARMYIRTIRN